MTSKVPLILRLKKKIVCFLFVSVFSYKQYDPAVSVVETRTQN